MPPRNRNETAGLSHVFVLNFAGAAAVGVALLVPLERAAGNAGRLLASLLAGAEIAAVFFLGAFPAGRFRFEPRMGRWPIHLQGGKR